MRSLPLPFTHRSRLDRGRESPALAAGKLQGRMLHAPLLRYGLEPDRSGAQGETLSPLALFGLRKRGGACCVGSPTPPPPQSCRDGDQVGTSTLWSCESERARG